MVLRLVLCAMMLGIWAYGGKIAEAAEDQSRERPPDHLKVFSDDGSESLTATCRPKNKPQEIVVPEVTCRFTHVRFQKPSPPPNPFPSTLEEAVKADQELAAEFHKNPAKKRAEWDAAMGELAKDMCSTESREKLQSRIAGFSAGSRRKELFTDLLQACSHGIGEVPSRLGHAVAELERSTCEVFVDHFSLDFRRIYERKWLFTQQQPSVGGTLKVYELTAEGEFSLWTLTETRVAIGQNEGAESQTSPLRKTWSWKNWESYELPNECHLISHRLVQYEFE